MSTVLFDTGDLNEVEEAVSASYSHVRLVRPPDETSVHARIARSQLCSTPVDDVSFGLDVTYQMEPLETILLGRIYSGAMSVDQPGLEPRVFGPGEVTAAGAIEALPMFGNVSYCPTSWFPSPGVRSTRLPRTLLPATAQQFDSPRMPLRLLKATGFSSVPSTMSALTWWRIRKWLRVF